MYAQRHCLRRRSRLALIILFLFGYHGSGVQQQPSLAAAAGVPQDLRASQGVLPEPGARNLARTDELAAQVGENVGPKVPPYDTESLSDPKADLHAGDMVSEPTSAGWFWLRDSVYRQ